MIGIVIEGQPFAVPHRVLWNHEILNLNFGDTQVAVDVLPPDRFKHGFRPLNDRRCRAWSPGAVVSEQPDHV